MKPPVAPGGWMELLDREKEWNWGRTNMSFEDRMAFYLKAIEDLGRPLSRADTTGKWAAAYHFWVKARRKSTYDTLPLGLKRRLSELPYFFDSASNRARSELIEALIKFKSIFERLPRMPGEDEDEELLFYKYKHLLRWARQGRLSKYHHDIMTEQGLLKQSLVDTNKYKLKTVELFIKKYKRWPTRNGGKEGERKLHQFIRNVLCTYRYHNPDSANFEALRDLPGCPFKDYNTVQKKGTHK